MGQTERTLDVIIMHLNAPYIWVKQKGCWTLLLCFCYYAFIIITIMRRICGLDMLRSADNNNVNKYK